MYDTIKTDCPDCAENAWFRPISRMAHECAACGNIEQDIHCADCGGTRFYKTMPFGRTTRCRSCGCTKEPVFG